MSDLSTSDNESRPASVDRPSEGSDLDPKAQVVWSIIDDFGWIRLGPPTERLAILSESKVRSLDQAIRECETKRSLKGVIITGSSPTGFCGGADVRAIEQVENPTTGAALAKQGQDVFARVEQLAVPTVALIWGACVGGGCELALACRFRVGVEWTASTGTTSDGSTFARRNNLQIGLPEVKLGILPGFGGTQRLPRVVGLPAALDIILKGKTIPLAAALRRGLIDASLKVESVPDADEQLERAVHAAQAFLLERTSMTQGDASAAREPSPSPNGAPPQVKASHFKVPQLKKLSLKDKLLTTTSIGRALVRRQAGRALGRELKGRYPAPPRALDVVLLGLDRGIDQGYAAEARALGELIATPECKSLVHIFQASEAASKLGRAAATEVERWRIGVIGAGVMGAGIAAAFLRKNHAVVLIDTDAAQVSRAQDHIREGLARSSSISDAQRSDALARLVTGTELSRLADTDLIIEAIIEDVNVKGSLFGTLEEIVGPETVIATNTSSLSLSTLATKLAHPRRFVGLHFFNPAEKMPLVEVVRSGQTDTDVILRSAALVTVIGKYPVIVEDVPGFLVNRILTPYLAEAGSLLASGVPIERIDRVALDFGMPMGPFRLLDEVGLDVGAKVGEILEGAYGSRMAGPPFAKLLVAAGFRGKKSGTGFYLHEEDKTSPNRDLARILSLPPSPPSISDDELRDRLILALVNEAVRCLDEGVAGVPGREAAAQIDLATVMGTGFAPFRGGVLHYASRLGAVKIAERMAELQARTDGQFVPARFDAAPGIIERVRRQLHFTDSIDTGP